MKYLYNYNNIPSFYVGALCDIFEEEIYKDSTYDDLTIKEKTIYINVSISDMMININNDRYFISDIVEYKRKDEFISIIMDRFDEKKYLLKIQDDKKLTQLEEVLKYIIKTKEYSLNKYQLYQEEMNKNYEYYQFKIRVNNEEVFYMYYGDLERMNKEDKIELVKIVKKGSNLYLSIKDNKFKLNKMLYPYLYNNDIENIFCSNIEIVATLNNYYVDIEMELLIKTNQPNY